MTPIPELTTRHSNSKVVVSRLGFDPSTLALKGQFSDQPFGQDFRKILISSHSLPSHIFDAIHENLRFRKRTGTNLAQSRRRK